MSETRAACCRLCVTMTIVNFVLRENISSSTFSVAIGSSAEHGSSIRTISGSMAMARAMHSRCICPPDSDRPLSCSRSFTSSQSAAPLRLRSHASSSVALFLMPAILRPYTTFS